MSQIQHIVLLKFKPETSSETISELLRKLENLKIVIPGITYFAGGAYSSHEGLNKNYTHGFLMTFESAAARDHYLPHPAHEQVKAEILKHIDDVIAFDIEA
ncbi:MAG TPA: Dabb family protein [Nostocaceae cyanobacterium]|nr:Dabb family protein [Nostocaceae cyanobacterium]